MERSPEFERFAGVFRTNVTTINRVGAEWRAGHVGPLCPRRRPCGPACAEYRERHRVLRAGIVDTVQGLSRAERFGVKLAILTLIFRGLRGRLGRRRPPGDQHSG